MSNITEKLFLQSIRGKVLAAFLIGAIAIGLAWVVTRVGFKELLFTVNKLSTPNEKLQVVNSLFHRVTQLDQLQRTHAIKNPGKPYAAFKKEAGYLLQALDTLRNLSAGNALQVRQLDSMEALLQSRDKLFTSYLKLRADLVHNEALSKRIQAVSKYIAHNNQPKVDSSIVITNKHYITTTTLPASDEPAPAKKPKKTFFGRLFSTRKVGPLPPALKQVEEELRIQVDTLSVAKQDSSIGKVQQMMRRIERDQHQRTTRLLNRELALVNAGNQLHNQLLAILRVIEAEEIKLVKQNNHLAKEVVQASITRMNTIMLFFFLVAAMLVYFIFTDIARSHKYRKQLVAAKEEAEHLGQVKQRFLANMSHEIRTPLQAIIGFSEQVQQQSRPRQKDLEAIHRSAEHLLQIVNEVLDYSRITSGQFTFEQQVFNVREVVKEVIETMRLPAEQKSLRLRLDSTTNAPILVCGDAFRLRQILFNLVGNAIKFTPAGQVSVKLNYTVTDQTEVTFKVSDTGIGIPPSEQERIFGLFEQADASVARTHGGTGLGLSIVKTLVQNQGGRITVTSAVGKGSRFNVLLPFANATAPISPATSSQLLEATSLTDTALNIPPRKILVIDDDSFILQLCATILNNYGLANFCTADAVSVLKYPWDAAIDLVLLDIRMPEINGLDVCRELRKKVGKNIKIVALTAQALPEEREAILGQGFDGLLMKPFREQELLAILGQPKQIKQAELPVPSIREVEPDLSLLIKMTGGDEAQLKAILNQFIIDTQHDLQQLSHCLMEGLPDPTGEVIHRLAGRTGQVGSRELSARLRTVEVALTQQRPLEHLLGEIDSLQHEITELKQSIRLKVNTLQEV